MPAKSKKYIHRPRKGSTNPSSSTPTSASSPNPNTSPATSILPGPSSTLTIEELSDDVSAADHVHPSTPPQVLADPDDATVLVSNTSPAPNTPLPPWPTSPTSPAPTPVVLAPASPLVAVDSAPSPGQFPTLPFHLDMSFLTAPLPQGLGFHPNCRAWLDALDIADLDTLYEVSLWHDSLSLQAHLSVHVYTQFKSDLQVFLALGKVFSTNTVTQAPTLQAYQATWLLKLLHHLRLLSHPPRRPFVQDVTEPPPFVVTSHKGGG